MQITFETDEKLLVNVILTDIIKATARKKDRGNRKYAQKLCGQFDVDRVISNLKVKDLNVLGPLIMQFSKELMDNLKNEKVKEAKENITENLEVADKLMEKIKINHKEATERLYERLSK